MFRILIFPKLISKQSFNLESSLALDEVNVAGMWTIVIIRTSRLAAGGRNVLRGNVSPVAHRALGTAFARKIQRLSASSSATCASCLLSRFYARPAQIAADAPARVAPPIDFWFTGYVGRSAECRSHCQSGSSVAMGLRPTRASALKY